MHIWYNDDFWGGFFCYLSGEIKNDELTFYLNFPLPSG
jgi:hypothetical protein